MRQFAVSLRLYSGWFIACYAAGLFILYETHYKSIAIITCLVCIAPVYFISQPSVKRYNYLFYNAGYSALNLFLFNAAFHLSVFVILVFLVNAVQNA